jgi:hypothetical protein
MPVKLGIIALLACLPFLSGKGPQVGLRADVERGGI